MQVIKAETRLSNDRGLLLVVGHPHYFDDFQTLLVDECSAGCAIFIA
jgi:hypothetical protein